MRKTRNLFIISGKKNLVLLALDELHFKGLSVFTEEQISSKTVMDVFFNNKSVVCCNVTDEDLKATAINIVVTDTNNHITGNVINIKTGNIPEQFISIANQYDCDIGGYESNSSGLAEIPKRSDCPYCKYMKDGYSNKDINLYRTLYRSKNFFVMPPIGGFIHGYLLIVPNQHVMSNAELSFEIRDEFLDVLEDVAYMLNLTYQTSNLLIWENGSGNGGIGKAKTSIVHSHTHVAPSKLDADKIEELAGFPFKKISYEDLHLYKKYSYLLIRGENDNDWRINDDPNIYIPRQYVRQLLLSEDYTHLPDSIWNWRDYPFIDKIKETCIDIQSSLLKHWDEIPERIRNNTKEFLVKE